MFISRMRRLQNMSEYPQDFEDSDVDQALRELLNLDKISMDWDEDSQEFIFYMSDEQKAQHDLEHDEL